MNLTDEEKELFVRVARILQREFEDPETTIDGSPIEFLYECAGLLQYGEYDLPEPQSKPRYYQAVDVNAIITAGLTAAVKQLSEPDKTLLAYLRHT